VGGYAITARKRWRRLLISETSLLYSCRIDVNFLAENGAWADVKDWDNNGAWRKYHTGKTSDSSFTITFDYVLPYSNSGSFLEVGDLYRDVSLNQLACSNRLLT
jgi:hypothetical protein